MKVAVVGLGAAGIHAARLLHKRGCEVSLFEARDRVGGRLHTVRRGGVSQFDLGGEWIDADHSRCLSLIADAGMKPRSADSRGIVRYKGRVFGDGDLSTEIREDVERVEREAEAIAALMEKSAWKNEAHRGLDQRTLATFLDEHCRSAAGRWYCEAYFRSDEGEDSNRISLLGWLSGYAHYVGRPDGALSAYRFPGGAGAFFESLLAGLPTTPRLGSELIVVRQEAATISLALSDGDWSGDRCLITVPPPCVNSITFVPQLTNEKSAAFGNCAMSRILKVCLAFREPFWERHGWSGSMLTDAPIQQTWLGTLDGLPTLNAYVCGDGAGAEMPAAAAGRESPVRWALTHLCEQFPEAGRLFISGDACAWHHEKHSRGGFSYLAPGYATSVMRHIATPHGRVHFAGEHTATWTGFIEGALESAERAVEEMLGG